MVNSPPTITFTFVPIAVPQGFPVDLTVSVADADADKLTVSWEITRGTLTPVDARHTTMTWDVPFAVGTDTVAVSVSDGEATVSTTQVLKVGTLVGLSAPAAFETQSSPYILRAGDTPPRLLIGAGESAIIQAGVEIFVDLPETIIDISGSLAINGTADQPVVIRANDRTLRCGQNRNWWTGIFVGSEGQEPTVSNGNLVVDHVEISYAVNGIHLREGGRATVRDSKITCCGANGILHEGEAPLTLTRTAVTNVASNGVTVETDPLLPASISITDCDISINGNTGLSLNFNDVFENVPVTIEDSRFEFNGTNGIMMTGWVWPTIQYNNFSYNGSGASNIRLQAPFHDASNPDSLDVTCNYWGAVVSNQTTIENSIRDRLDSTTLGTRLLVKPWLNADPYQATTPPPCTGGTAQ